MGNIKHRISLHLPDVSESILRAIWTRFHSEKPIFVGTLENCNKVRDLIDGECDRRYAIWIKTK